LLGGGYVEHISPYGVVMTLGLLRLQAVFQHYTKSGGVLQLKMKNTADRSHYHTNMKALSLDELFEGYSGDCACTEADTGIVGREVIFLINQKMNKRSFLRVPCRQRQTLVAVQDRSDAPFVGKYQHPPVSVIDYALAVGREVQL
jgi:hypothetical protein